MNPFSPSVPAPASKFKRFLRCIGWGMLGLVILAALLYAEENWWGKHAWQNFKREWEAQGVRFDLASIIPPTVPDDQNFAATPLLAGLFGPHDKEARRRLEEIEETIQPKGTHLKCGSWLYGQFVGFIARQAPPVDLQKFEPDKPRAQAREDWKAARARYAASQNEESPVRTEGAAHALLASLQKVQKDLDEIAAASRRPHARFPMDYNRGLFCPQPHLAALRSLARALTRRACAELVLGDADRASEDIRVGFCVADAVKNEPLLISHLVRIGCLNLALQPVWEGLAEHRWNEAQLAALEKELVRANPLVEGVHALQGERIMATRELERMAQNKHDAAALLAPATNLSANPPFCENCFGSVRAFCIPSGLFYQNIVGLNRFYLEHFLPTVNTNLNQLDAIKLRQAEQALAKSKTSPYNILVKMLMPAITRAIQTTAFTQTSVDEARVACALERFRLKNGHLPERLAELVPSFLDQIPKNVINGDPLKYRREAHDRFTLWSVGWDGKDDGGTVAWTKGPDPRPDRDHGDWVWPMPK